MPTVTMPQLGEGVEEGTIGKWLKGVGDHVRVGDPLVEVVTDKVNAEVPSPFEGVLTQIHVAEGETVANDAAIAEVEAEAAAAGAGADGGQLGRAAAATTSQEASQPEAEAQEPDEPDSGQARDAAERGAGAAAEPGAGAAASETAQRGAGAAARDPSRTEPAGAASQAAAGATEGAGRPTASPGTSVATIDVEVPAGAPPAGQSSGGGNAAGNGAGAPVEIPAGIRMTPAVRRLARERGVDVSAITGSGLGGRITREDVEKAPVASPPKGAADATQAQPTQAQPTQAERPAQAGVAAEGETAPSAASPVAEGDSLKRLSPMRKAIAAQMTRSLEVPTAYITIEVDMTRVVRRRNAINAEYKAREGMSLSYVAFVTKACVEALRKHHDLNAHWTEEGHWRRKDINIGIAVAVPDGLVVPVVFNADRLSLHGLNTAINDLAARARTKKLKPEEMRGSTFTVDNTGWTGSILTLPIINVPEVAIITMEKVVKRPVVLEDQGDAIAVRSMMNMCIAIDHRATDGAQAGEFLADVRRWLEAVDDATPVW